MNSLNFLDPLIYMSTSPKQKNARNIGFKTGRNPDHPQYINKMTKMQSENIADDVKINISDFPSNKLLLRNRK